MLTGCPLWLCPWKETWYRGEFSQRSPIFPTARAHLAHDTQPICLVVLRNHEVVPRTISGPFATEPSQNQPDDPSGS